MDKNKISGAELIALERQRQVSVEGWTPEHDDEHEDGDLAVAAACYATPVLLYEKKEWANGTTFSDPWRWDDKWDGRKHSGNVVLESNPLNVNIHERIRQLEKAGGLVAAEIDRLIRVANRKGIDLNQLESETVKTR